MFVLRGSFFRTAILDLFAGLSLNMTMRFQQVTILSLFALLALSGCANKKGKQYAGVDGDYVNGTPLGERSEGANFLGANVQRGQYAPVQFGYDSSSVSPDQESKVAAVASALKGTGKTVIVAGFTDERGTQEYNRSLGEKRALAVREALIAKGLQANNVQTVSFGAEMPVDSASNDAAWAKNRRAEFGIVK
jgi:peptidoglycan-associated lipoprotein